MSETDRHPRTIDVCLVALPESTPGALYGLHEVFGAVGVTWTQLTGERSNAPRIDARIVSADGRPFDSPSRVRIVPHGRLDAVTRCDVAICTDLATGYTPIEYVQALRIEEAKHLLETTDQPLDDIAAAVGYEDPAFFRQLFKRRTAVTPARYRQRMQSMFRHVRQDSAGAKSG